MPDVKASSRSVATAMTGRLLRTVARNPWLVVRNIVGAAFFYVVATVALKGVAFSALGIKSASMLFPMSVLLAVSGLSQAALIADEIQRGFFDRLVMASTRRFPVMIGCMLADMVLGAVASLPLIVVALIEGITFRTGIGGVAVIVVTCALWAAAYGGLWYAVAFWTGDPAKARGGFAVFIPVVLFAPSLAVRASMTGVIAQAFAFNPVSYVVWRAVHTRLHAMLGGEAAPKPQKAQAEPAMSEIDMLREALEAERQARQRAENKLAGGS
jgi:hypothetical protein